MKRKRARMDDVWSVDDERPRLKRADLVRYADFWRRSAITWMDWADKLIERPNNGLWGSEGTRRHIARELRVLRLDAPDTANAVKRRRAEEWAGVLRIADRLAKRKPRKR